MAIAAAAGITITMALHRRDPVPYVPGEQMEGLTRSLGRDLPSDYPPVRFADVTTEVGIDFTHFHGSRSRQLPEDMGSGAAWADYDADGHLDLFVVNQAGPLTQSEEERATSPAHNALFQGRGDGTFQEVSASAGVDFRGCGQGVAWGDYDGDGRDDLCVTNYGQVLLYHNEGGRRFSFARVAGDMQTAEGFWSGASWTDYDRDGDLDLYVCGYVRYEYDPSLIGAESRQYDVLIPASLNPSTFEPERNLLFRNDGGYLTEVAATAGVDNPTGRSLSASWADLDGDGWPDLYVANDLSDNALYRNLADGSFEDISHAAWVADYRGAMGLATGDWDGDGDTDLFVTHWIAQENALYSSMTSDYRQAGISNAGAPRFMDVADRAGLGQVALDFIGWGTAFADYDNDGRLDLLVVNGSTFEDEGKAPQLVGMHSQLFWNRGVGEGFFEVGEVSGEFFGEALVGRGLALADYDADGDVDAFVNIHGGRSRLLRNDGGSRSHWLRVRLRGPRGNPRGIGSTIRVVVGGTAQSRQVGASSSYLSQHATGEEVFGLGVASRVDTVEVSWLGGSTVRALGMGTRQTVIATPEAVVGELAR